MFAANPGAVARCRSTSILPGSWCFGILAAVAALAAVGCRKETVGGSIATSSSASTAGRQSDSAPSASLGASAFAHGASPIVDERHNLGQPCTFWMWEGPFDRRLRAIKRIVCEFMPKAGAPVFEFEVLTKLPGEGLDRVTISSKATGWKQVFADIKDANAGESKTVEITDVNFDGFQDLRLLESWGTGGYAYFAYWIYMSDVQRYVLNEDLRLLVNAEPDPRTRSILGEPDDSKCRGHDQYRLDGERLVLVKRCIWTGRESTTGREIHEDEDMRRGLKKPLPLPPGNP